MEKASDLVARLECDRLYEQIAPLRDQFKRTWRKLPLRYRWTHDYDGRKLYLAHVYAVIFVALGVLVIGLWVPAYFVGNPGYHLENGVSYECPGGDWMGNTSQMISVPGDYRVYYYCPVDGRLIGSRMFAESIPFETLSVLSFSVVFE